MGDTCKARGSWVGALCPWCHCPPTKSGGPQTLQRDAAQPPLQTPRMAEVATPHPAPRRLPRNQYEKKRKKKEEKEGAHTDRQARRPSRGSRNATPAGWKCPLPVNLQSTTSRFGNVGWGLVHGSQAHRVRRWHGFVSARPRHGTSR